MKIIVSVLLVALSFSAFGQIDQQKLLYLKKVEKYRKMRNTGFAFAAIGAGCGIYGLTQLIKSSNNKSGQYVGDPTAPYLWLAGAPLFATGITLGLVGTGNYSKYQRKLQTVTINLNYSPRQAGLALVYKF